MAFHLGPSIYFAGAPSAEGYLSALGRVGITRQMEARADRRAAYPSSISSLTSWVRVTPLTVRTILAGSFSLPLRRPASSASRTAFSISRCEVMPTFLRNLRRLALKTSSFMRASWSGLRRIVQHVFAEVALAAVDAGVEVGALDVAILSAG